MNEEEWLASNNPAPMLEFLQAKKVNRTKEGRRKLVLFGCACCRRINYLLTERGQRWLDTAERHADGESVPYAETMGKVHWNNPADLADCSAHFLHASSAMLAAGCSAERALAREATLRARQEGHAEDVLEQQVLEQERLVQTGLLRDIFGNPFRPVLLTPAFLRWNDRTLPKLAQAVYDSRQLPSGVFDTERMAILADAIEEAGNTDRLILDHLGGPVPTSGDVG